MKPVKEFVEKINQRKPTFLLDRNIWPQANFNQRANSPRCEVVSWGSGIFPKNLVRFRGHSEKFLKPRRPKNWLGQYTNRLDCNNPYEKVLNYRKFGRSR